MTFRDLFNVDLRHRSKVGLTSKQDTCALSCAPSSLVLHSTAPLDAPPSHSPLVQLDFLFSAKIHGI